MHSVRTPGVHRKLNLQLERRQVGKTCLAVVHGRCAASAAGSTGRYGSRDRAGGRTHPGEVERAACDMVERLNGFALVKAVPTTGRRHQIRVHFCSIGCAVVGNWLTGDREVQLRYPRQRLHGPGLPVTRKDGRLMVLAARAPPSFQAVVEGLRRDRPPADG